MAAFLNSIITVADKVSWYIGVCRDMGIQVLPPDINTSEAGFSVDGHTIRFGLGAIKSVGDAAVTVILEERKKRGPFRDFFDFTRRVDLSKVNKRVVEALIKCGSMNGFGLRRSQLLAIMDPALEAAASEQRDRITGQLGLFGEEDIASANTIPIPNLPEIPKAEILRLERELIGFYVTGHPLDAYRNALRRLTPLIRCTEENYKDGERIAVGGIITDLRLRSTKNGDRMASFVLEDLTGSLTVIAFPRAYAASRANIDKDRIVMIQGILKLDEEHARIFANRVEPLQEAAKEVHLHIGPGKNTQAVQQQLGGIFAAFHGKTLYTSTWPTPKKSSGPIPVSGWIWMPPLRRCHRTGAGEGEHGMVGIAAPAAIPLSIRKSLCSQKFTHYLSCNSVEISVTELGLNYLLI